MDFLIIAPGEKRYKFLGFGGGPSLPPATPPPPTLEDPEVKRRVEKERLAKRRRKGFAATTLTKPGLGDVPALTDRARLTTTLGGGRVA